VLGWAGRARSVPISCSISRSLSFSASWYHRDTNRRCVMSVSVCLYVRMYRLSIRTYVRMRTTGVLRTASQHVREILCLYVCACVYAYACVYACVYACAEVQWTSRQSGRAPRSTTRPSSTTSSRASPRPGRKKSSTSRRHLRTSRRAAR
jgi:hypothetical protein